MPKRYTSQEYANMLLIYEECRCNASDAARLYRERYLNLERYPDHRVFVNVHRSLTEGGHFPNQIRAGGRARFPYEEDVLQEWHQQDGCLAHYAVQVRDFFDEEYPEKLDTIIANVRPNTYIADQHRVYMVVHLQLGLRAHTSVNHSREFMRH